MAKSFDFWFSSAFTSYHLFKVGAGRVYGRALVYGECARGVRTVK
jgi:hypothetical protein